MLIALALMIGVVAGLRAMTAPAAVAWAAYIGWIDLTASPLAFMGSVWAALIFTILALAELVTDQLPSTPSRKVPLQFGTRILIGALCGGALGSTSGLLFPGLVAGAIGAVIGTLGGAALRGQLAASLGRDRPAALLEDAVAIIGAIVIVAAV